MSNQEKERLPFPIGFNGLFWMAVAGVVVYFTVRDAFFQSQTDPVVVRTIAEARSLEDNKLVDVHLPLDPADAKSLQFSGDNIYTIVAFKGTGRKLFYVFPRLADEEEIKSVKLPLQGRSEGKDFAGSWNLGSINDVKLKEVFKGTVPEDALVVRPVDGEGLSWWRWTIGGIAALVLGWMLLAIMLWPFGINLVPDDDEPTETASNGESETGV